MVCIDKILKEFERFDYCTKCIDKARYSWKKMCETFPNETFADFNTEVLKTHCIECSYVNQYKDLKQFLLENIKRVIKEYDKQAIGYIPPSGNEDYDTYEEETYYVNVKEREQALESFGIEVNKNDS
jgi:hypothetical protein